MRSTQEINGAVICTTAEEESSPDPETVADESDLPADSGAGDELKSEESKHNTGKRRWRRWLTPAMRWAAVGVVAAVAVGAGYEGWLLFQQHQKQVAATQALDAAQNFAVTLTSTDPNAVDQNFTDILGGATGDFKDTYTKASSRLRKMLIDNKVATRGIVLDSAVKSATTTKVVVLLFVKQSVTNSASPDPRTDFTDVTMTMEKVNGRWLASEVVLPAEQG